jgi:hypothetical protein
MTASDLFTKMLLLRILGTWWQSPQWLKESHHSIHRFHGLHGTVTSIRVESLSSRPSTTARSLHTYNRRGLKVRDLKCNIIRVALKGLGTGVEWKVKEMESGHSPQLSQPENLSVILLELAKEFEAL